MRTREGGGQTSVALLLVVSFGGRRYPFTRGLLTLSLRPLLQLVVESVYLYGSMLLLMERHLPGPLRERLIVAHYRYAEQSRVDDIAGRIKRFSNTLGKST